MNLIGPAQDLLLNQKKEKAQSKIQELLAPIFGSHEIPTIQDSQGFGAAARALWESTGVNHLSGLLSGDTSYRSQWEVEQLKTVTDFVIENSDIGLAWVATAKPPEFGMTSVAEITPVVPSGALWANFENDVTERICDYVRELASGLESVQSAARTNEFEPYYTSGLVYTSFPWRQVEYNALLYGYSYISWLLYVHQKLEESNVTVVHETHREHAVCVAAESNKVTPQVSKRPPPFISI